MTNDATPLASAQAGETKHLSDEQIAATGEAVACCPYCSKPMVKPVTYRIIDRGWDNVRRKQYVRQRDMEFCSNNCGSSYQMGCEG